MKNWNYKTSHIRKVCERKLGISFKKDGKEFNGWFWLDGRKICRVTVPKGRKAVPPGTYGSIARQLKIHHTDLDDLLGCPMTRQLYEQKVRAG